MDRQTPRKIIIDCDPGIDDALAILLALNSPEVELLGITVVSGNVPAKIGAENALKILEIAGRLDIPVYLGEEVPLVRELITAQDTHGDDGLGDTNFPKVTNTDIKTGAVEYLLEMASPDVHLIALGPYTNLAKAIAKDSEKFNSYASTISMGGNYKSHGNCSDVAEFNFWVDPDAVGTVFNKVEKEITMVGLDVTREIVLTPGHRELLRQMNTPLSNFIYAITRFYVDFHWKVERTLGCVINDPLAVLYFIDPTIASGITGRLSMVTEGKNIGQSVIDENSNEQSNVKVLTDVDSDKFFEEFFNRLFPEFKEQIQKAFAQI